MAWNKAELLPRIAARAAALGKSVADVLPPGYETFFAPSKTGSPTITTLEKIADGLGWSLCELLCGEQHRLRQDLLDMAVTTAVNALADQPELLPEAIASIYDVLVEREREDQPNDTTALSALVGLLRRRKGR